MSFRISYAGNREDVIIEMFFPDVTKGFYVDVGANDPVEDSVTKIFYDKGWHGINIEPLQTFVARLNKRRPRDLNIRAGIAKAEGELVLREYKGGGRSTFSDDMKRALEKDTEEPDVQSYTEYKVPTHRLETVLEQAKAGHIHFMKIDVEGLEDQVIESNDWQRFRPELLCIEANHVMHDWHEFLRGKGYSQVFFDGLNEYFLAEESMSRMRYFDYPRNILSGAQIIKWTVKREFDEVVAQRLAPFEKRIATLEDKLATVQGYGRELEKRLDFAQSPKGAVYWLARHTPLVNRLITHK